MERPRARDGKTPTHKGPTKVRRAATYRTLAGRALTRDAEEVLFACADVLTEGQVDARSGSDRFYGCTMITFDLARAARYLRDLEVPSGTEALARLVEGSVRMRLRAMRIACAEAARRVPERTLGMAQVESRVRYAPGLVHLDVDVEVPFVSTGTEEFG